MARTPENILREIVADNIFRIAQLMAENDKLKEDFDSIQKQLTEVLEKLGQKDNNNGSNN